MVRRTRLLAAGIAVVAPLISFSMFVAGFLMRFPPLPYEVLLFSYWGLQFVLVLIAPIAAVVAMLLSRRGSETGWRLTTARFVMPLVGLLLWLIAGTSVVLAMPAA